MMKKMLAVIIGFLLLLPRYAAAAESVQFQDASFENQTNEQSSPWSGPQLDWGENSSVTITEEKAHNGSKSVKIVNNDSRVPWVKQRITGLFPGVTYRLTYWIYAEPNSNSDVGMGATLTFYKGSTEAEGDIVGKQSILYYGSTNARWTEVTDVFVVPENTYMLRLLLRMPAQGYVYFDDVSIQFEAADKVGFSTSHVFHYTDDKTGTVRVFTQPYYVGKGLSDCLSASFAIYDGNKEVANKSNVRFTNEEATYIYSVPDVFKVNGKQYTLKVEVYESNKVLETFSQSLYKYERPKFLDKNGIYRDETGEVVNPVIAYHLDKKDYAKAKEAGFTMFQIGYGSAIVEYKEHREGILEASKEAGLKGVFSLYVDMKAAAHPDNIENTKKLVEQYKDDTRFFAWIVQDEPLGAGMTQEAIDLLELSYKTIRDIDPNHPIILADYNPAVFQTVVKYCDIFIPNSYGASFSGVRGYTEEAVKYACGRPVYPNVGAHARGTGTEAELPTGDQLQHFMYQAFMGGAKGVSMYSFSDVVTKPAELQIYNTALWEPLCDIGQTQLPTLFDLFVHSEDGEKTETSAYAQRKWTKEDGDYYCLMSVSDEDQTLSIDVGENKIVSLLGGDNTRYLSLNGETLSVSLLAGDVLLFKVHDPKSTLSVTQNGVEIKKLEEGEIIVTAPEGSSWLLAALYAEINGTEELVRMVSSETGTISLEVYDNETAYTLKAFAWDKGLKPLTLASLIE